MAVSNQMALLLKMRYCMRNVPSPEVPNFPSLLLPRGQVHASHTCTEKVIHLRRLSDRVYKPAFRFSVWNKLLCLWHSKLQTPKLKIFYLLALLSDIHFSSIPVPYYMDHFTSAKIWTCFFKHVYFFFHVFIQNTRSFVECSHFLTFF